MRMIKTKKMKIKLTGNAEAVVLQRPYMVILTCPFCGYDNEYGYSDFCDMYGEPPEWDCEIIDCRECGRSLIVNGQNWD